MTTERDLDEILAEIGRDHREMQAPDVLERGLFAAAAGRKHGGGGRRVRRAPLLAVAAVTLAVLAAGGVLWQLQRGQQARRQEAHIQQQAPMRRVQAGGAPVLGSEAKPDAVVDVAHRGFQSKSAPFHGAGRGGAIRPGGRDSERKQEAGNSLDEFVPLPVSEGLPEAGELSVVRMRLRGSDLQQYGLQAPADAAAKSLVAEFVVGEDGLPRAIRIVR